jgi:hypothetical protein
VYKEQPNQPFPPDSGLDMAPRDVHCDVQRYIAKRPVAGAVLLDRLMCELQLGWLEDQHWWATALGAARRSRRRRTNATDRLHEVPEGARCSRQ